MKIDWNSLPAAAGMRAGATRKRICGDRISAVRVTNGPDTRFDGTTHWHENEQPMIVTEGERCAW